MALIPLSCPIVEGLSEENFKKICEVAEEVDIKKGDKLFSRGEKAKFFYILKEGRCSLSIGIRCLNREENVFVSEVKPNNSFGWSSLVEPKEYIYSAYCLENGRVFKFEAKKLEELMEKNTDIGYKFHRNLNRLISNRTHKLQELWIEEIEGSLEKVKQWVKKNAHLSPQA